MSSKTNMSEVTKLEKVLNYEFNEDKILKDIKKYRSKSYKTDYDYKTIRNLQSELKEYDILKYINDDIRVLSIEYMKDLTSDRVTRKLTRDEYKSNKFNQVGIDLLVETKTEWVEVDMKVLNYYRTSKGKLYNGGFNCEYGVDNLIFQIDGKEDKGWATDRYKQTKRLYIYIPQAKTIYKLNYRNMVKWLNNKIWNSEINENDKIVYPKRGYKETLISIPIEQIPQDVLLEVHRVQD